MTKKELAEQAKREKIQTQAAEMMTKSLAALVLDDPFYGYLLLRQEIKADWQTKTAATDGKRIIYNPKFVRDLSSPQLKGLLKHEVMHIAHMHHLRRQNRDPRLWNMAADYVINALLKADNTALPEGALFAVQYADKHTEEVYELLPKSNNQGQTEGGSGDATNDDDAWNVGEVLDLGESMTEEELNQAEMDVKADVIAASNTATIMGKNPKGVDRLVEDAKQSRMPWRRILARHFNSCAKNNTSWARPNRRFISDEIFLPSSHSEVMGPVVIGIDTSGSMSDKVLQDVLDCVNGMLKQTMPESVHIVACDASVQKVSKFKRGEYPIHYKKVALAGGGGTDFRPVFKYIQEQKLRPSVVLYLTDGDGRYPDKAPRYPVYWGMTTTTKAPWGRTLEIK